MKSFFFVLLICCVLGCGGDPKPPINDVNDTKTDIANKPKSSLNLVDYMYSGKVGTEYIYTIRSESKDTNGKIEEHTLDTLRFKFISDSYQHPTFGKATALQQNLIVKGRVRGTDMIYYAIKNDTLMFKSDTEKKILSSTLKKGSIGIDETTLQDFDVQMQTPAGTFTCIVAKSTETTKNDGEEKIVEAEMYYAEGVVFCKYETKSRYRKLNSSKERVFSQVLELVNVKNK